MWVRENAKKGADGIKFFGAEPTLFRAALPENKLMGLRLVCHRAPLEVARMNVLATAKAGLTLMEPWYGLPEALFTDQTIQDYPVTYNYANEQNRFGEAGKLWQQSAKPGTPKWNQVLDSLIRLDFTIDLTFNIYEANRELMLARRAEWHDDYTLPSLWRFYGPSRISHGSYRHSWGTEQEVEWKRSYQLWIAFVNAYKNRGGASRPGPTPGSFTSFTGSPTSTNWSYSAKPVFTRSK